MKADVVVVGAGVVGAGIAFCALREGLDVVVLDASTPGLGTSANSFSWINATSKTADEAYHRLNARGCEFYRSLAIEVGERTLGMYRAGMLEWADGQMPEKLVGVRDRLDRLMAYDYPVTALDARGLRALEPHVTFRDDAEGLYAYADAWLDVPVFVAYLLGQLRAGGAKVLEQCRAGELVVGGAGEVVGVSTEHGIIHAPHVVVAAGIDTGTVLATLTGFEAFSSRFPITPGPGLLLSTPPVAGGRELTRRVLYTPMTGHLHVRPSASGGLLMGADDTDGMMSLTAQEPVMREGADMLLKRTAELIPAFAGMFRADECHLRLGLRPMPGDGESIIGPLPGAQGLYVVVTHSGVTLTLALGDLLARHLKHGESIHELERFSPQRFQSLRV